MSDQVIEFHECAKVLETVVEGNIQQAPTTRCTHVNLDGHQCESYFFGWSQPARFTQHYTTTRSAIDAYRKAQDDART